MKLTNVLFFLLITSNVILSQTSDNSFVTLKSFAVSIDSSEMYLYIPTNFILFKDSLIMYNPENIQNKQTFSFESNIDVFATPQLKDIKIRRDAFLLDEYGIPIYTLISFFMKNKEYFLSFYMRERLLMFKISTIE